MSKKKTAITAVKGMKDILPAESRIWQIVEAKAREIFERFNFAEIRVPVCEKTELFSRGIGDATDIVEKEMFSFPDKNGESMTLRPEGTASVVRACIENNLLAEGQTLKLYYIGPMFRYEKPQKGRQRQFHQIGAEALGLDDPMIDAEMIHMCCMLLNELGIDDYRVEINSLGTHESRADFTRALLAFLEKNSGSLCQRCLERKSKNPLRFFDCKEPSCGSLVKKAPSILDHLDRESRSNFETVQGELKKLGITFEVNPRIVRGLDYYTKTVFEFVSQGLGAQNSILGGGRYNSLFSDLGGNPAPACGFAAGIERLILLLGEKSADVKRGPDVYIANIGDSSRVFASAMAKELRESGLRTECEYRDKGLRWKLGQADKIGASFAVIIGEDEISKNTYIVRNMQSKEQIESNPRDIAHLIKSLLKERAQ